MYNRVHHDQKQRLILKSYIPRIDSWICINIKLIKKKEKSEFY